MNIDELKQAAMATKKRFDKEKEKITAFKWYPYGTLSSLWHLDAMFPDAELMDLFRGKRLVDLGAQDGDNAFFYESLGIDCTAIDNPPTNHNGMKGIHAMKAALDSKVPIFEIDLNGSFELPEDYDVGLLLGVLYHLENPVYALKQIRKRVDTLLLSTKVASHSGPGEDALNIAELPLAYFLDSREANNDPTNFWVFSETALHRLFKRSGWDVVKYRTVGKERSDPYSPDGNQRAFALLKRANA